MFSYIPIDFNKFAFFISRFSYYYIPNKMTETKYGKKDDLAIMTRLFADSVSNLINN